MTTTATKHTPGPWKYGELSESIIDTRGRLIASLDERSSDPNVQDDARLIASAPDLLAERDRLRAENAELRTVLARAQALRGDLLGQLSYVPECVLDFCNRAKDVLSKARKV